MTWWDYVQGVTGGSMNQTEIAEAVGIDQGTVSRWKTGGTPRADNVIAFARTYKVSPLEALYRAGLLRKEELGQTVVEVMGSPEALTNEELVRQIERRLGVVHGGRRRA